MLEAQNEILRTLIFHLKILISHDRFLEFEMAIMPIKFQPPNLMSIMRYDHFNLE